MCAGAVRTKDPSGFDIHDRVNYAVTGSNLRYNREKGRIELNLQVDETICTMYDYFDIFLQRMIMCRHAAETLGTTLPALCKWAEGTVNLPVLRS